MANRTLTKALQLRLPDDVKEWIEAEAAKNSCSQNSEIIRAIRERMERTKVEEHRRLPFSDEGVAMAKQMAKVLFDANMDIEKNDEDGPCASLLRSRGFNADLIDSLRNRIRFEFYELLAKVPGVIPEECLDEPLMHHLEYPEYVA